VATMCLSGLSAPEASRSAGKGSLAGIRDTEQNLFSKHILTGNPAEG
jgi:hypothetical protein